MQNRSVLNRRALDWLDEQFMRRRRRYDQAKTDMSESSTAGVVSDEVTAGDLELFHEMVFHRVSKALALG
jgi:hypothetical protein